MSTNQSRFWIVALGLTLIMSQTLGQVDQPGSAQKEGGRIRGGFRMGRGVGVTAATLTSPPLGQTPQQRAPRFEPQGVRHRVPQDYATIQAAIDASNDGDTVMVSEGKYFENIRYHGKGITVGSLYVIDGDTSHIGKTIIDGSRSTQPDSGSVVYFIHGEDTASVLCGLTIQGGTGTNYFYNNSQVSGWFRAGGGILCDGAGPRIVRNFITHNRMVAQVPCGGGLEAFGTISSVPFVIVDGNHFTDNFMQGTGTRSLWWSGSGGADISGVDARIVNNVFERDTVIGYMGAYAGGMSFMIYGTPNTPTHGYIIGNVFRSNHIKATQEGAVAAGLLIENTGEVTVQGNLFEANSATSSNGWAEGGALCVNDQDITGNGRKMILNNRFLNNSAACNVANFGGGMELYRTLATVSGNEFTGNSVAGVGNEENGSPGGGAAIGALRSSFRIENNIITRNSSARDGGGVAVSFAPQVGSEQVIIHNTIVDNYTVGYGGGLRFYSASNAVLLNNICWDDTASVGGNEIFVSGSIAGVSHCDVQGGWPSDPSNISVDPRFAGSTYRLSDSSKCIGAGRDSVQIGGTWYRGATSDFYGIPRPTPPGSQPDIGACENSRANPVVSVGERTLGPPLAFALAQNYPNPFNPSTTIKIELPRASHVSLTMYDILGRQVSVLVNDRRDAGVHEINFDGSNLASGVYFYRLQAGDFVQSKKLVLLR